MEYISLHGYISNTCSDTEVHAEYQLGFQEYPSRGKEYIEQYKIRAQALSLWSGSTESKTQDYQRTNSQFSSIQPLSHF